MLRTARTAELQRFLVRQLLELLLQLGVLGHLPLESFEALEDRVPDQENVCHARDCKPVNSE